MPVSTIHKEYALNLPKWELTRAANRGIAGEDAKKFITRRTRETDQQWSARAEKAIYTNYTGRTREGLKGAIFRLDPRVEVPDDVAFLLENADGSGQSLDQVAKYIVDEVMLTGRIGIMADYPSVQDSMTLEEIRRLELQPHVVCFTAESIINWHTAIINGRRELVMVVLRETKPDFVDEFQAHDRDQYRVLRLTDEYIYTQQIYNDDLVPITEQMIIRDSSGQPFNYIPFYFIGSRNNLPSVNDPMLYDIARVNIGHFRNSADHESNLSIHGGGTLVITTNMSVEQFAAANPGGITVGENSGLILSEGGRAELLQLDAAGAIKEEMIHKELQIVSIGAKLVHQNPVQRTAQETKIQAASESSALNTLVDNISESLTRAISDCRKFITTAEAEIIFELNTDFWQDDMNAQDMMAMIQGHDAGVMPKVDIVRRLKDSGWIQSDEHPEDILAMIDTQNPI